MTAIRNAAATVQRRISRSSGLRPSSAIRIAAAGIMIRNAKNGGWFRNPSSSRDMTVPDRQHGREPVPTCGRPSARPPAYTAGTGSRKANAGTMSGYPVVASIAVSLQAPASTASSSGNV